MQGQMQLGAPMTPTVKRLIIANMVLWVGLVLILQNWILDEKLIFQWFGFTPLRVWTDFWIWQPLTYMFVHSENVFHVLFNMLTLWWFGSELEMRWGRNYFLKYYLICGAGAAVLYMVVTLIYALVSGNTLILSSPVVGASGAVFGLMYAYGKLFGDRVVYFMMMFPMKARTFVAVIGGVEILNLLSSGFGSQTANLAHLGGLVVGFVMLWFQGRWPGGFRRKAPQRHGRNLKLVVNNESSNRGDQPRYWN